MCIFDIRSSRDNQFKSDIDNDHGLSGKYPFFFFLII